MVQQVNVDGQIHEFPDEATPEMMQNALSSEAKRQRFMDVINNNIVERPIKRLGEDTLSLIKNIGGTLSSGIPSLMNQLSAEPGKAGRNVAAGIGTIPISTMNAAFNIPQWLAHLESNKASDVIKKFTPQLPTDIYQNLIGGENPTQEDVNVRNLAQLTPIGIPIGKAVGKGIGSTVNRAVRKSDPLLEAKQLQLEMQSHAKEADVNKLNEEHTANLDAYNKAVAQSQQEVGKSNPDLMQYNLENRKNTVEQLQNQGANLQQQLSEIKPEESALPTIEGKLNSTQELHQKAQQDAEEADAAHKAAIQESKLATGKANPELMQYSAQKSQDAINSLSNDANALKDQLESTKPQATELPQAEKNLSHAQETVKDSENLLNINNNRIRAQLHEGATHDVRTARIVKPALEENKKDIQNEYNDVEKNYENKNVTISNSNKIKKLNDDLIKLTKAGKTEVKDVQPTLDKLHAINEKNIIPASDYVSALRAVNGYMREAYKKAYEPGINEETRNLWKNRGDEAKSKLDEMNSVLKENIGEEDYQSLKNADTRWKNEVVPLYSEPLYWQIMNKEKMSGSDMIGSLRGGKPGSGIEIIRNTIKNNPEALKHVVGQRYSQKPSEIHNPNEEMQQYLDKMPELTHLRAQHKQASQLLEQAKNNAKLAQQQHAEINERHTQSQKIESDLNNLHDKIQKDKENLSTLQDHIDNLKEAAKNKNISLDRKMAIEKEMADLKSQHSDIMDRQAKSEKLEVKIKNLTDEVNYHQNEIPKIEENIARVRETTQRKNMSLQEKMAAEKELKDLRKKLADSRKKVAESAGTLRKLWKVTKTIYRIGKKLL